MIQLYFVSALIWLFLLPQNIQTKSHARAHLHETISLEAKPYFEKGVLLLHNFEYPDAIEQFILAQEKDPDFPLSFWGEAMCYDHPIWRDLDADKARAALKKLGATPEERQSKGKTDLEKDLISSIEILFGAGSKPDREKAYADYMQKLYEKYSDNNDVAAFYALSLLGIKKSWNEWDEYNVKAAEITEKILRNDPNHAGALHYMVHADDHPQYASNGLAAANKYGKVASYAGHALHMPSHIYLALGMWDDVVKANEVSWQASLDRQKKKQLDNDELSYHTHLWLMYGYLQQGRFQKAKEVIDNQIKLTNELSSSEARFHLLTMKGIYLAHTNEWNSTLADMSIKTDDLGAGGIYISNTIEAYKFFRLRKTDDLAKLIASFENDLEKSKQRMTESAGMTICSVNAYNIPLTEQQIQNGYRKLNQMKALHAWLKKDMTTADDFFKASLPKEGTVVVGPPSGLYVSSELYGEFLLANKKPAEALQQYEKALTVTPNRYIAMKGKAAAARALKDREMESKVIVQLKQQLKQADAVAYKGMW